MNRNENQKCANSIYTRLPLSLSLAFSIYLCVALHSIFSASSAIALELCSSMCIICYTIVKPLFSRFLLKLYANVQGQ